MYVCPALKMFVLKRKYVPFYLGHDNIPCSGDGVWSRLPQVKLFQGLLKLPKQHEFHLRHKNGTIT